MRLPFLILSLLRAKCQINPLNHEPQDLARVYNQHNYQIKMTKALIAWEIY